MPNDYGMVYTKLVCNRMNTLPWFSFDDILQEYIESAVGTGVILQYYITRTKFDTTAVWSIH